jgi:hypothetical protein
MSIVKVIHQSATSTEDPVLCGAKKLFIMNQSGES